MQIPCVVGHDEKVGHGIVSSDVAKASKKTKIRQMMLNHVRGNGNLREISTDRLSLADGNNELHLLAVSADCRECHPKRWFQGWAEFDVGKIQMKEGFRIKSTPMRNHPKCPDNEYHADIQLPSDSSQGQNWVEYVSDLTNDEELWTWKNRPPGPCAHPTGSCNHP